MRRSFVFWFTGVVSMVTVEQPPILPAALGQDVVLPCSVQFSPEEQQVELPVLYWQFKLQNPVQMLFPSEVYRDRVDLLDPRQDRLNNSIRLRRVQWSDGGPYLCKLTVTTEARRSFRAKGNQTTLMVHDRLVLVLVQARNGTGASQLHCAVNVSQDASFTLSILHQGAPLPPGALDPGSVGGPSLQPGTPDPEGGQRSWVTLSQTAALQRPGQYECRLLLQNQLVSQSSFNLPALDEEPWHLYGSLLLVPVAFLLLLPCIQRLLS